MGCGRGEQRLVLAAGAVGAPRAPEPPESPESPEPPESCDITTRRPGTCCWIDRAVSSIAWSANSTLDSACPTIHASSPADSRVFKGLNTTRAIGNPKVASRAIDTFGASTDTASPGSNPRSWVAPASRSQRSANSP